MLCYGDNYNLIEPVVRAYQSVNGGINDLVISATANPDFENLIEDFMSVYMASLNRYSSKNNIYDYIFQESIFYSYGKSRVYNTMKMIQASDYLNSRQLLLDLLELSKTLIIEDYPLDWLIDSHSLTVESKYDPVSNMLSMGSLFIPGF